MVGRASSWLMGIVVLVGLAGCGKSNAEGPAAGPNSAEAAAPVAAAAVGKPAPTFSLKDLDGKEHALASYAGKTVVLEWFNPDCPFVVRSHKGGPLETMAKDQAAKGVVWLAINSGSPGKQGTGVERNRAALAEYALSHPILLDESGAVGKLYNARNTPGMYIIDKSGVLAYAGALDNAPSGKPPEEGYRNHVAEALEDLAAGRPVKVAETKAYGCSVKYAD